MLRLLTKSCCQPVVTARASFKPGVFLAQVCHSAARSSSKLHSKNPGLIKTSSLLSNYQSILCKSNYRIIHLTPKLQIPPVAWMILRPVMKLTAVLSGRAFRKWWRELPKDKKAYFKEAFIKSRTKILAVVSGLFVTFCVNYYAHLQEAPVTGRRRFIAFTKSQYSKIADFEAKLQEATYGSSFLPADHKAVRIVQRVTERIRLSNPDLMTGLNFRVAVINNDENVNAFVLPTGDVYVFTGILKMIENEDQLAIILGHEMAHAILQHGAELVSMAQLVDVVVIVVMAMIWAFLPNDGVALVAQWFYNKVVQLMLEMPYSRNLEREADEVGLYLASRACYDIREAPVFWTKLDVSEKLNDNLQIEWLSTHPSNESRAQKLEEMMTKALNIRRECNCPRLPRRDPRDSIPELNHRVKLHEEAQNLPKNTVPIIVSVPSTRGALLDTKRGGNFESPDDVVGKSAIFQAEGEGDDRDKAIKLVRIDDKSATSVTRVDKK